jgi:hypothetical protein
MKNQAVLATFEVDERVRVRAGHQEVKKRAVLGTWTTEATVHEISQTAANYYKLRWTTRGLNAEACGAISKRWYAWTALKKITEADGQPGQEVGTNNVETGEDQEECGKQEVGNQASEESEDATVTMSKSPEFLHKVLQEVASGTRHAWRNRDNSCHVDSFLMLEIAAIVAAPWRFGDKVVRGQGMSRSTNMIINNMKTQGS